MKSQCLYGRSLVIFLGIVMLPSLAQAAGAGGGMPWESMLDSIVNSLTGPVARALGIVSLVVFGGMMALSEGGGLRMAMGIIFGLSIMFAAASWGLTFFGFAGGAVI